MVNQMKFKILMSMSIILSLTFSLTAPVAHAKVKNERSGDNVSLTTDTLAVEIKGGGNVPFFFFYKVGENETTYKLQLSQIFEAEDDNSDGVYDNGTDKKVAGSTLALSSLSWEFSDFDIETSASNETQAVHFNLTSSASKGKPSNDDLVLQFRMHLNADDDASLKFDVVIDGYTFSSESAMLVVAFKLTSTDNSEAEQNQNQVRFGNGFFESEESATDDNGTINVGLSSQNDGGSMIYLAYEHFEGRMTHDPTIGVASNTAGTEVTDESSVSLTSEIPAFPELSRATLVSITAVSTIAFLGIITLITSKKRQ